MLALPVAHVVETMRPQPIAGEGAGIVLGTARIRGERCAVIDAARLLDVPSDGAAARFLVVRAAGVRVALRVDDVLTVRWADGDRVGALAATARDPAIDAVREVLARARWTELAAGEGAR